MLVRQKDKTDKSEVCGLIYKINCEGHDKQQCGKDYIGEIEITLKARFSEHRIPSSSSSEVSHHIHKDCPGHAVSMDSVKILDRDPSCFQRGVKESIYIRAHKPELNRDGGRVILPHICDNSLTSLKPSGSSGIAVNPIQQYKDQSGR